MAMITCPKCQKSCEENATVCEFCGASLVEQPPVEPVQEAPVAEQEEPVAAQAVPEEEDEELKKFRAKAEVDFKKPPLYYEVENHIKGNFFFKFFHIIRVISWVLFGIGVAAIVGVGIFAFVTTILNAGSAASTVSTAAIFPIFFGVAAAVVWILESHKFFVLYPLYILEIPFVSIGVKKLSHSPYKTSETMDTYNAEKDYASRIDHKRSKRIHWLAYETVFMTNVGRGGFVGVLCWILRWILLWSKRTVDYFRELVLAVVFLAIAFNLALLIPALIGGVIAFLILWLISLLLGFLAGSLFGSTSAHRIYESLAKEGAAEATYNEALQKAQSKENEAAFRAAVAAKKAAVVDAEFDKEMEQIIAEVEAEDAAKKTQE